MDVELNKKTDKTLATGLEPVTDQPSETRQVKSNTLPFALSLCTWWAGPTAHKLNTRHQRFYNHPPASTPTDTKLFGANQCYEGFGYCC